MSVFVGNGQALVLGGDSSQLTLAQGEFPSANPEVAMVTATGTTMPLAAVSGGEIGGLLDFRREMLEPTRNTLGQMAIGLAEVMNGQNQLGMDLDGNLGGDLFSVGAPAVTASTSNTGGASVSVQVASASGLTPSNYLLAFDGGSYSLTRLDTGCRGADGGQRHGAGSVSG